MKSRPEIVLVGDRVLIDPATDQNKTPAGLYLPPGVKEKEKVHGGYVVKTGPGFPAGTNSDEDVPWSATTRGPNYIPLQAQEGDYALFLRESAIEIELEGRKYLIVPHSSILVLLRDNLVAN
jgi:co-chaperonin GroES (HSP10)